MALDGVILDLTYLNINAFMHAFQSEDSVIPTRKTIIGLMGLSEDEMLIKYTKRKCSGYSIHRPIV